MNTKKLTIKSLMIGALALLACDPEYPTPYVTNEYNSNTNYSGVIFMNFAQNSTAVSLAIDNAAPVTSTEVDYMERFPASNVYDNTTIRSGSRNIRVFHADTSFVSTRANMNGNIGSSFYVIGRADVNNSLRSDRPRLVESLNESLPAVGGNLNTVHFRLLNFGLTAPPVAPSTSGGTLGSIALRIDATSANPAPALPTALTSFTTNGTYFLPEAQTFPLPAPATTSNPDYRTIAKSYANATSPFTTLTMPAIGTNTYTVDVVNSANGNVILADVVLSLTAGRVYTFALIGSPVGGEQPYQLLVIRHR